MSSLDEVAGSPSLAFPIVGIGASAGGLAAFEAFFSGMPADRSPDMAFVLVQHMSPDHESLLADLVRRYTRMKVFEVEDGMTVQPNCVYIIPPNHDLAYLHGTLQLLEPTQPHSARLPIDFFFRSLALDLRERAIGVVLSGMGSDGARGVRAIKAEGGMVMAQTPESTEFDGMPRSAIATRLVDYTLLPAEMPEHLMAYAVGAFGKPPPTVGSAPQTEAALKKIFVLLRAQTTHDFSQYKPSTIHRRVERRMVVHQVESMDDYVAFLRQTPSEVDALFRELLIGVTAFFRDGEAFAAFEAQVIPRLFADKTAGDVVRVWCAGCSTGEEAYSLAMLLQEHAQALKVGCQVQVFATDLDENAIATARAGVYPASIAANLTPARLAQFFTLEADGTAYRVRKSLRDLLVFSTHDVIKDPPFSRLDLISCRNLLIYFSGALQKKLIPLFHYALRERGVLFLGTSEGVGDFDELFTAVDRKAKLYERNPGVSRMAPSLAPLPVVKMTADAEKHSAPVRPLREVAEAALLRLAPAATLVNEHGDILFAHGRTGMFLELMEGPAAVNNVLKMAREGLRPSLSSALHQAVTSKQPSLASAVRVKTNGHFTQVELGVYPVPDSALFLVTLKQAPEVAATTPAPVSPEGDERVEALKRELLARDEHLQATREELETSNEELKSSNEEMQSVNEELQSANEEMETSREELQSVNEELATVNAELSAKVLDLSRSNNDMNNLLSGTGIATVFLDPQLRILRFTPAAAQIINLIPGDIGRPVSHLVSNLVGYDSLATDAQVVLDTLEFREAQVQIRAGNWFTMRVRPYRTVDNVISGVVITFVDITDRVKTQDKLKEATELSRLAVVVRDASDSITVQDLEWRTLVWNPGAVRLYGWSEAQALLMNVRERIPQALRDDELMRVLELSRAEVLAPYRTQRLTRQGDVVEVLLTATALRNEAGTVYAIATTERPIGRPA
jgi:two-component system CheB/CheR fusion protein